MNDRLMAYLDGELTDEARRDFEAEIAADPALAAEVAAHRELAGRLSRTYHPVLDEPVPQRLELVTQAANEQTRGPRIPTWAAIAASLVIGVAAGRFALRPEPAISLGADLPARSEVARALDRQLAGDPGVVRIGLTFRDVEGRYCRTFQSAADRVAGLACRGEGRWRVTTATAWSPAAVRDYRTAASATPPEVLAAVDRALAGEALDTGQEKAARDAGWR
jgi:hypothetical protein